MAKKHTWVILLRGINVGGVKVPMADLKKMLEEIGMSDVKTLLASGNVVLTSDIADAAELKRVVEAALAESFGKKLTVLIRTLAQIQALVDADPFQKAIQFSNPRLNVTFLGSAPKGQLDLPWRAEDGSVEIIAYGDEALLSVHDGDRVGTIDAMAIVAKTYGKDITTRNWNTVQKIAALGPKAEQ